jgi:hypothetical protein
MARERSPNYPAHGLPSAIQFAKMVWTTEKRTATRLEVIARALGSEGLSGPARSKIATMRQFGLLEPAGEGLRVSNRALTLILQHPGEADYDKAAVDAFLAPPLFAEFNKDRPEASDEALRVYLVRDRRFSPDGAIRAIKSYRESAAFIKPTEVSYNGADERLPEEPGKPGRAPDIPRPDAQERRHVTFSFSLPSGVKAEVSFSGRTPPTKRDAQKLRQYLELFEDDLEQPEGSTVKVAVADEVDLT